MPGLRFLRAFGCIVSFLIFNDTLYQLLLKVIHSINWRAMIAISVRTPKLAVQSQRLRVSLSLLVAVGVVGVACAGGPSPIPTFPSTDLVQVVTTTAILADFVRNVGGDRVDVRSILPSGADPHSFQSTPSDSIAVSGARLIVSNGMGLDAFLDSLVQAAGGDDAVYVVASDGLQDISFAKTGSVGKDDGGRQESDDDDNPLPGDPHFWQNPAYAIHYVQRIRDGLIRAHPSVAEGYQANAAVYIAKLRELDREIGETLKAVPPERRRLVTFHDAFGHFGQHYGWDVSAFVPWDGGQVTPGRIVEVMERIKGEGIPVVFVEPQFSPAVMEQAARDTGVAVGAIYSDSLNGDVSTYIEMMRFNANSLLRLKD